MAERVKQRGAVVIPAHNEESVIMRTLSGIAPLMHEGVEIVVVANGCTDGTVALASSVPGVQVIVLAESSKAAALNAGDDATEQWPRLYLDADIAITPTAVRAVLAALEDGVTLAARPGFRYETDGSSWLVRAYYRARMSIPQMREHLWGAGAYALSEAGHARLGRFPGLVADDLFVDGLFRRCELAIVATQAVEVRSPRTLGLLVRTLRRVYGGRAQVAASQPVPRVGGVRALLAGVDDLRGLGDALIYVGVVAAARLLALRRPLAWHRDDSNRPPVMTKPHPVPGTP